MGGVVPVVVVLSLGFKFVVKVKKICHELHLSI